MTSILAKRKEVQHVRTGNTLAKRKEVYVV